MIMPHPSQPKTSKNISRWTKIRQEANAIKQKEPEMARFIDNNILNRSSLEETIIWRISEHLAHPDLPASLIQTAFQNCLSEMPKLSDMFQQDLSVTYERDPACERLIEAVLYFKGFHAIQTHRLAHWLYCKGRRDFALYLQSRSSSTFQVDIHPAAPIGHSIFLDHATGLVVGGTASIGNNVSILQNVTLGGTGNIIGNRHPKIGDFVLIGAGAKILGNIKIGTCSRIAAGSVVLKDVPAQTTVAGVPAKIVGQADCSKPANNMNHILDESDNKSST